jgi:2-polyprenyl-6-methoxyphenol hydroxylase-like FAD-dependent oxidoreductase
VPHGHSATHAEDARLKKMTFNSMAHVSALRVAVVGASLGGLSAANVLNRLGAKVTVFECFPSGFHERGGALGSVDARLLEKIRGHTASSPARHVASHGHFYGDLWQYLWDGLPENTVHFGVDVVEIVDATSDMPTLVLDGEPVTFDLVIGADGGRSTVRKYVTDQTPVYAGYTVWRGLAPAENIQGPPSGGRTVNGVRYETLGFPFENAFGVETWNCGIYMMTPESEVAAPFRNRQVGATGGAGAKTVPDWFVPLVTHLFGAKNGKFWQKCVAHGKVNPHPVWELACDQVVNCRDDGTVGRIILLGDAAHTSSPRTGAGAYTAMKDAVVLGECLSGSTSLETALAMYNDDTVRRGKELFERSRQAATYFAPENAESVSPATLLGTCRAKTGFKSDSGVI